MILCCINNVDDYKLSTNPKIEKDRAHTLHTIYDAKIQCGNMFPAQEKKIHFDIQYIISF